MLCFEEKQLPSKDINLQVDLCLCILYNDLKCIYRSSTDVSFYARKWTIICLGSPNIHPSYLDGLSSIIDNPLSLLYLIF